jgi:hypothetical protein
MLVLDRKALGIFNERPNTGSDMRGSLTTWRIMTWEFVTGVDDGTQESCDEILVERL